MERKVVAAGREVDVVRIGLPFDAVPEQVDVELRHRVEVADEQREVAQAKVGRPGNHSFTSTPSAVAYISCTYCLTMRRVVNIGSTVRKAPLTVWIHRCGTS